MEKWIVDACFFFMEYPKRENVYNLFIRITALNSQFRATIFGGLLQSRISEREAVFFSVENHSKAVIIK